MHLLGPCLLGHESLVEDLARAEERARTTRSAPAATYLADLQDVWTRLPEAGYVIMALRDPGIPNVYTLAPRITRPEAERLLPAVVAHAGLTPRIRVRWTHPKILILST